VSSHFGALHALVNNAALGMNAVHPAYDEGNLQIEDVPDELWQRFMAVNVNGPYFMARAVVPALRAQKWGRIINITTSYLTMMRKGFAPYGPSKAAIEAWTQMLSGQLEGSGITVNVVLPGGPVDTQMIVDYVGLDRSTLISPDVMTAPVLGLFTDAGGAVTGQRFIAVEWDEALGTNPAAQPHRSAAWPELAQPLSKRRPRD
jgi:NAD(P)-dependent dehydrogenase (short-subunit alcohol dehydrogenase family)